MDSNHHHLLTSALELALNVLEKNGTFLPFCKGETESGQQFVYTPSSDSNFSCKQAYESIRSHVLADVTAGNLSAVAFCFDTQVRLSDSNTAIPAIEIRLHQKGQRAAVWYFVYRMEGSEARVMEYYTSGADEDLFA